MICLPNPYDAGWFWINPQHIVLVEKDRNHEGHALIYMINASPISTSYPVEKVVSLIHGANHKYG